VNFVFPDNTEVNLDAVAGLGGRLHVAAAHLTTRAASNYPEAVLDLVPAVPSIGSDCHALLASVNDGLSQTVLAEPDLCLSSEFRGAGSLCTTDTATWATSPDLPEGHADSMTCAGTASRISGSVTNPCKGDDPSLAWRAPIPAEFTSACMDVLVTGHFARCVNVTPEGGCSELTTDCTPPLTEFGVLEKGKTPEAVNISCLPPFAEPITFSVRLDRPAPVSTAQNVALFFHPPVGATDAPCFFDLYSLALRPADCAAP
jgi:hypothetical protein